MKPALGVLKSQPLRFKLPGGSSRLFDPSSVDGDATAVFLDFSPDLTPDSWTEPELYTNILLRNKANFYCSFSLF